MSNVDHPSHYQGDGMEAIDVIESFKFNYNKGNAFAYMARASKKGAEKEDIQKAIWHLQREEASLE